MSKINVLLQWFFLGGIPVKEYYKAEEWRSIDTDADLGIVISGFVKSRIILRRLKFAYMRIFNICKKFICVAFIY